MFSNTLVTTSYHIFDAHTQGIMVYVYVHALDFIFRAFVPAVIISPAALREGGPGNPRTQKLHVSVWRLHTRVSYGLSSAMVVPCRS